MRMNCYTVNVPHPGIKAEPNNTSHASSKLTEGISERQDSAFNRGEKMIFLTISLQEDEPHKLE